MELIGELRSPIEAQKVGSGTCASEKVQMRSPRGAEIERVINGTSKAELRHSDECARMRPLAHSSPGAVSSYDVRATPELPRT